METGYKGREKEGRRWWRILVEAAAVIAVPSALLYVLGVLVFWLRIASEYDGISLGTTWYAASLVPRSTAAASGIEAISRGFVYGVLAGAVILFVAHIVIYVQARRREQEENVRFFSTPLLVPSLLALAAISVMLLNLFLGEGGGYGLLFNLRVVVVMLLLVALVMGYPWIIGNNMENTPLRSLLRFYPRPLYRATVVAVAVVSMFVVVLLPGEASLSCLWKEDPKGEVFEANAVGTQSETDPQQWALQGGFLSRSDGTWYVLTEANRLQAIPDDDSVRVVGGDFSVRYLKIGSDGTPTREPVPEENMESWGTYVAVQHCSGFPSQPTIYKQGNVTVTQSNSWIRERTRAE